MEYSNVDGHQLPSSIELEDEDFLVNVCPLNPDNLEECQACQWIIAYTLDIVRHNRYIGGKFYAVKL